MARCGLPDLDGISSLSGLTVGSRTNRTNEDHAAAHRACHSFLPNFLSSHSGAIPGLQLDPRSQSTDHVGPAPSFGPGRVRLVPDAQRIRVRGCSRPTPFSSPPPSFHFTLRNLVQDPAQIDYLRLCTQLRTLTLTGNPIIQTCGVSLSFQGVFL